MKTNHFLLSHSPPIFSVYSDYSPENPTIESEEVKINSRARRMVASLREMCWSKIHPSNMPQCGIHRTTVRGSAIVDTPDECFTHFLNKFKEPKGIQQNELNQLTSEWIRSITRKQIALLNATFFNALSREQIQALTPAQVSWIQNNEFKKLAVTFLGSLTRWQTQAITRTQLQNIPSAILQSLCEQFLSQDGATGDDTIDFRLVTYLTAEQLGLLTDEQVYAILEVLNVSATASGVATNIPQLLRVIGQNGERVRRLPESILRRLDGGERAPLEGNVLSDGDRRSVFQGAGLQFSYELTETQRNYLSPEQREMLAAYRQLREWAIQRPIIELTRLSNQEWKTLLLGAPPRALANIDPAQIAAIPPRILASFDTGFWKRFLSGITRPEIEYFTSLLTKNQVVALPLEVLVQLPVRALSPDAIPAIPPHLLALAWGVNKTGQWTLAQVAAWTPDQVAALLADILFSFSYSTVVDILNRIFSAEAFNSFLITAESTFFRTAWRRYAPTLTRERMQDQRFASSSLSKCKSSQPSLAIWKYPTVKTAQ